jgi:hypothetical protein
MCTVDGLTFISILDLNMGFWMIHIKKATPCLMPSIAPGSVTTQDLLSVFMTKELNSQELNFKNSFNPMESKLHFEVTFKQKQQRKRLP